MKYKGNTDFFHENLILRRTPKNAIEAYNKLVCLMEHEKKRDQKANSFYVRPFSKRRERIVKMFLAYSHMA